MSVTNGQLADQNTFNNAFLSRTVDTSTIGRVDLLSANAASGPTMSDIQRLMNSLAFLLGVATSLAYNATMSWASDIVGVSGDTFKARIQALVATFHNSTGHKHDGTQGGGAAIPSTALAGWAVSEMAIPSGSSSLSVTLPIDMGVSDYKVNCAIRNETDTQPIEITWKIKSKSNTGFVVEFGATTDSANYVLEYFAAKKTA